MRATLKVTLTCLALLALLSVPAVAEETEAPAEQTAVNEESINGLIEQWRNARTGARTETNTATSMDGDDVTVERLRSTERRVPRPRIGTVAPPPEDPTASTNYDCRWWMWWCQDSDHDDDDGWGDDEDDGEDGMQSPSHPY